MKNTLQHQDIALRRIAENKQTKDPVLDLGRCGLTQIPDLSDMDWLETLILSDQWSEWDSRQNNWVWFESQNNGHKNRLSHPPVRSLPVSLKKIMLWDCQISDGSFLGHLTNLTSLGLDSNQVKDLSPVKHLRQLSTLHLMGNPIQYVPKETYAQWNCAEALFDYFDAIESGQKVTDRQMKIMFLGNGCTGKTTLLHWFLDGAFKDLSLEQARTHGIIIQPYTLEASEILANFWDFGGQEVYHATHRLFMGRRSLYILMWAKETPESEAETMHMPQYWLDMIADLTESGERSRVLIVQNQFSDESELDIFESNEQREDYRKRGLDISTHCINAKTGDYVDILKMIVQKEAVKQIETNVVQLPEAWVAVRKAVAARRHSGEKVLPYEAFGAICEEAKLPTSQSNLLHYLHSAGELFYYENQFHNQIILDQQWALQALYAILKKDNIGRYGGIFTVEDLRDIWRATHPGLTEEETNIFLNFMLANEIAFRLDDANREKEAAEQKLVVPQLLTIDPLPRCNTWNRVPEKRQHRIEYRFLHRSIIERFMVKTGVLSQQQEFWRDGLFINPNSDDEAMIVVREEQRKIRLWDDRDIRPGEDWDDSIRKALATADIIFLLLSPHFLATDYIDEVEIGEAMRRHEAGEAKVIPIKIRPCSWKDTPFAALQGLPRKDGIVSTAKDRDLVWLEILEEIRAEILGG